MNWDAIGAIGEVAGAIGVIATLIYLSLQIRSNTKATESQVHASLSSEMESLVVAMSTDDALADAYLAAQSNEDLTPKQRLKLLWWFSGYLRACESHIIQRRLEATSVNLETPIANLLRSLAGTKELRKFIERGIAGGMATEEFLSWLDSEVLAHTPH